MKAKCSPFPALTPTHNHPNSTVTDKSALRCLETWKTILSNHHRYFPAERRKILMES